MEDDRRNNDAQDEEQHFSAKWMQAFHGLFLAFCIYAYFADDAGEKIRTGTDCTQFPIIMISDVAVMLLWLLLVASTMFCSVQGFDDESDLEEKAMSAGALFGIVGSASMVAMACQFGLKVWATIEYFRINSACWNTINDMGSPIFKIACEIFGIVCFLSVCSIGIAIFCFCCMCCSAVATGEVNADRRRLLDYQGA